VVLAVRHLNSATFRFSLRFNPTYMPMFPPVVSRRFCLTLGAGWLAAGFGLAAQAADSAEPKTLLTERGKLLFSDDLSAPPSAEWRAAKGKWTVVDGAWHGEEVPSDNHGGVVRHEMKFQDAIFQYAFKLEGTKTTTFSINSAKGHLCRVLLRPNGFTVQKDDSDHDGPDKAVVFKTIDTPIKAGEWHTLVVELFGKEMLASLDGDKVGFGSHDVIAGEKANFGFTVSGQSVALKNLRVWEALPNKNWAETKAKLAAASPSK
jgi:hypothetical protein